jgi:hypothetical protein
LPSWEDEQANLARLARLQLFFVGGAPRSGTTWLQRMLDCHPQVSCNGEGLFWRNMALPLEKLMAERRAELHAKNTILFAQAGGGYRLPPPDHTDMLLGTAILLALRQHSADKPCLAVGEKTPENVFFFPRLKRIFPRAKLITIARDPRDALSSAWHMFCRPKTGEDQDAAKLAFIRTAMPPIAEGARAMLGFAVQYPNDTMMLTYEDLLADQPGLLARLFRFLGVSDAADIVAGCVEQTSFAAFTGGRPPGVTDESSFFRQGRAGGWASTLTPEMNELILQHLGWMFPHFGWRA